MPLFEPTPRHTNLLVLLGCVTLGYALYLRYSIIEAESLVVVCAEAPRAVCGLREFVVALSDVHFFGGAALVAAVIHFARPAIIPFTIALVATALGLVLGNTGTSALAAGLLVMAFARPAPSSKPAPASAAHRRTTEPASSSTSH